MLILALLVGGTAWVQEAPSGLDGCCAAIDRNPHGPLGYYCIYRWVLAGGSPDRAVSVLERYFETYPTAYRAQMFIAWIDRMRERDDWRETLGRAVDGMEATGDDFGVVYGGLMLAFELGNQGDLTRSAALLERCARAAARTRDPVMQARVWVGQGVLATRYGDFSEDIHLLRRAERAVFPDGPYDIRSTVIDNLGADYWYLCQYRRAFEAFQRATRIREEAHDLWWQAITVYDMALCGMSLADEGEMRSEEVDQLLEKGLGLAVTSGNAEIEAAMQVLIGRRSKGEAARSHHRKALEMARRNGNAATEIEALEGIANSLAEEGPAFHQEALRYLGRAESRARETGQRFLLGQVLASKARLEALHGTPRQAVEEHLRALDFIEGLRAPQVRGAVRAQVFSRWDYVYYRLAGLLLARAESSPTAGEDYAVAFRTMERFRARELLDRVRAPRRISPAMAASEPHRRHRAASQRISEIQRRLADPELDPAGREAALLRLGELEEDESRLRDELQRRFPEPRSALHTAIPGLREVQTLLAPDQALLAYQLWDGEPQERVHLEIGESWLLLITRDRVRPIALEARRDLRGRIEILNGLVTSPDGDPAGGLAVAARLYEDLLGAALSSLPEQVRKLVIVPDDALSRCPFAMLAPGGTGAPPASHYEISLVPSAAVWAHLKRQRLEASRTSRNAALILCSPIVGREAPGEAVFRSAGPWRNGLHLEPLPHAADEARALRRAAGRGSKVLSGAEASEAALKGMELGSFGILDLVTHAVVDEEQHERSAIILAPGSETEDGFLQVREIPELSLDGQLVILSSCSSSSGRILGGEGAQSLARAFLEAGAGAVLASLWPLQDEQAASLFGELSGQMGRGHSVAEALRLAQRQARDAGMPAGAWAGVVVLGDGDLVPLPASGSRTAWNLLLAILVLTALAALLVKRGR